MKQTTSKKFLVNIVSNFFSIGVNLVVGVFMAPFLIGKLGIEMYGIIALANTLPAYIQIFTNGLSNSTTKYMSISMGKDDLEEANIYFYTSYRALNKLIIFLFPLVILIAYFTPNIFNVPLNGDSDSQILVLLVLSATLLNIMQAPFGSVYQVHHKFLEKNVITIFSKIFAVFLFIGVFYFFVPKVWFVGIYQLSISIFSGFFLFNNYSKFQKLFILKKGKYRLSALKELGELGFWNSVNDIAALFFLMMSQVLINHFLGVKESGFFGPILVLTSLLMMGSGALSNVMMPIIYRDIAIFKNSFDLEKKLLLLSKLMAYTLGLPIILMLVFANKIILLWLGDEFLKIVPVVQIFIGFLFLGGIIFTPFTHFYRGLDKIKIPAIINLIFGILNVLLTLVAFNFKMGLLGVAYAFAVTFGIRGLLFNIFYLSKICNRSIFYFTKRIGLLILILLITLIFAFFIEFLLKPVFLNIILILLFFLIMVLLFGFSKVEKKIIINYLKFTL